MGRLCSARYEREARQCGWLRIAGLDEAGRGSLFGPVVAGAVILNPRRRIVGLDDSKKLTPRAAARTCRRASANTRSRGPLRKSIPAESTRGTFIRPAARPWSRPSRSFIPLPDYLLLDAIEIDLPIEQKALIHGDARSVSIAAASILAKVERDRRMEEFDTISTRSMASRRTRATARRTISRRCGNTVLRPLHRFSYAPVREARCWAAGAKQNDLPLGIPAAPLNA